MLFENFFKAHRLGLAKDGAKEYEELQAYADLLHEELIKLTEVYHRLHELNKEHAVRQGHARGDISAEKIRVITERLIPDLQSLAAKAKTLAAKSANAKHARTTSQFAVRELKKVRSLLTEIYWHISRHSISDDMSATKKHTILKEALRSVAKLLDDFRKEEMVVARERRQAYTVTISPTLKRIYNRPKRQKTEQGELLVAEVTKSELRDLVEESNKLNSLGDDKYRVIWRRWWQNIPQAEVDKTTGLKDPHINCTIKLDGKKRDIHLLVR